MNTDTVFAAVSPSTLPHTPHTRSDGDVTREGASLGSRPHLSFPACLWMRISKEGHNDEVAAGAFISPEKHSFDDEGWVWLGRQRPLLRQSRSQKFRISESTAFQKLFNCHSFLSVS